MSETNPGTVTRLLAELEGGSPTALDELFPLVYEELRAYAHQQRQRWDGDTTLGTTALVNETYLKLAGGARIGAHSRLHFLRVAAAAMRHILCNYARDRRAAKRGGDAPKLSLDAMGSAADRLTFSREQYEMLLELDDALRRLEAVDPRLSHVVECRFFGGLSIDDTAAALGVSPATVKRDWALARAWLYRELEPQGGG
jgi:RNA polymerase sigma factor (TIGR02999 family)